MPVQVSHPPGPGFPLHLTSPRSSSLQVGQLKVHPAILSSKLKILPSQPNEALSSGARDTLSTRAHPSSLRKRSPNPASESGLPHYHLPESNPEKPESLSCGEDDDVVLTYAYSTRPLSLQPTLDISRARTLTIPTIYKRSLPATSRSASTDRTSTPERQTTNIRNHLNKRSNMDVFESANSKCEALKTPSYLELTISM